MRSEMPKANRHYIPGYIWNITHRCHNKEFLLRFAKKSLMSFEIQPPPIRAILTLKMMF